MRASILSSSFVLGLVALPYFAQAQTTPKTERFPFVMPWDDATHTVIDNADLNPAPLLDQHRIGIKNGHFFDTTGRRVRLLGTNFVASANFSAPADAAKVAGRLHKLGFNIVRLHHMDAAWSSPNIFGAGGNGPTSQVAPESMARLDNLVGEFKKHGIYVNLNLHVARTLNASDGFPDADKLPGNGKVLAYFDPQFIALQKDYARQILTHINPATGKRWADDPVVAVVELNNEDTLVGEAWSGDLQNLPGHYRDILRSGWNTFLKTRYQTTDALKTAWRDGAADAPNLLRNAQFADGTQNWDLETQGEGRGQISAGPLEPTPGTSTPNPPTGNAIKVAIEKLPDVSWKIQFKQNGLDLRDGERYTVSFWAKSNVNRQMSAAVSLDQSPWSQVGASNPLSLTPTWQKFTFVFRAQNTVPNHNRLSFAVGGEMGDVYLADLQLRPGIALQMADDQSLENNSIDLPAPRAATPGQANDWIEYLSAIEKSYVDTMTDTVRNEIGYKGLITCSQASYGGFGGVLRESRTDWIDMHAYWQHPNFPNKPWDANDWVIPNTAMTDDANTGTLFGLAAYRVAGKPFTVSEYNHPAPNDYASETVPLILSYAAAQDWDGIYLFDYNGSRDKWNENKIRGYFDTDTDPNKMTQIPAMARAFLRGDVPAFPGKTTLALSRAAMGRALYTTGDNPRWDSFSTNVTGLWKAQGLSLKDALGSRLELDIAEGVSKAKLTREGNRGGNWMWSRNGLNGAIKVDAPALQVLIGKLGDSWQVGTLQNKAWTVENLHSSNGWATLSLQSRDGKPTASSSSLLLTVLNRAENTGMEWNADRTSVGNKWGEGPALLEIPSARIIVMTSAKSATVYRLSPTGTRLATVPSKLQNGALTFEITGQERSPWFEVAAQLPATPAKSTTPAKATASKAPAKTAASPKKTSKK